MFNSSLVYHKKTQPSLQYLHERTLCAKHSGTYVRISYCMNEKYSEKAASKIRDIII